MKKLFFCIFLSGFSVLNALAQKDADAKTILTKLSKQYRSYDVVKTDFTLLVDNTQANIRETQTGTLTVRSKSNKYKVTIYGPNKAGKSSVSQEIISDGKNQWTYLKDANEVQLADADNSDDGFNPARYLPFTSGVTGIYTPGSKKTGGKVYQVIDLSPDGGNKQFFKIRLMIDKAKNQLYSAMIFDKNGSRYTYTLRTFTPNVKITDAMFTYDKKSHPGAELVDLK